jgi:hypothetical protein
MSFVIAAPEIMTAAATDLATIGSNVSTAHMAAEPPTVALVPAAADEVSTSIAHLFSQHAQGYQALAAKAAAFHEQFVQHLSASVRSYAAAEAANASSLLHPLAASTASIGGAFGAFWDQLVTSFDTAWGQLLNFWTGYRNMLKLLLGQLVYLLIVLFIVLFALIYAFVLMPLQNLL